MSSRFDAFLQIFRAAMGMFVVASGCASRDRSPAGPEDPAAITDERCAAPARGSVLFVLTAADTQQLANGKERATGVFLSEFYESYRAVADAGYTPVLASPGGMPAAIDPESLDPKYWTAHPTWRAEARAFVTTSPDLRTPLPLAEALANAERFVGTIVPGGQGVMIDLIGDPDLHALLLAHGRSGRVVGLLCHAPAILTRLPAHQNPFAGHRLTSVSGFEEFYIERFVMKGRATERRIAHALEREGYTHAHAFPGKSLAVRDRNLVTSQNPFSGDAFGAAYLTALHERERDAGCAAGAP